jgi:hypothetical protein
MKGTAATVTLLLGISIDRGARFSGDEKDGFTPKVGPAFRFSS